MKYLSLIVGGVFCMIGWARPVVAASEFPAREFIVGEGAINALDHSDRRLAGAVEVRFEPITWSLQPWTGITYAEKQNYLVSAGLVLTKQTKSGFRFSIGWAPSYYHRGGGKDLGNELEFYSFGEAGWMFQNRHVISLRFGHISNGGLRDYNPGTELLELGYSLPLGR